MIDNRNMAENEPEEVVEAPATETEPVTTPEEETPEVATENAETPETETPETTEEAPAESPEAPKTEEPHEEPKVTRSEKRIREVLKEKAELEAKVAALQQSRTTEFEGGEIDAATLDRVISERAIEAAKLMVESRQLGDEVRMQATEWANDLDKTIRENPELDPKSKEYDQNLAETLARALSDGNGQARLDLKASELYGSFKNRVATTAQKAKEEGKSEVSATLARQSQESAVTPSSKTSKSEEYSQEEIDKIMTTNPALYTELIRTGKI